ncbi:hypothetical protein [Streptomyces sp. NPDC018000]|uniref:hypothetical protein n=1 Tax=Streptomyces sp. NPDC018000 TaxID=3365028 RepID=UPI00379D710D
MTPVPQLSPDDYVNAVMRMCPSLSAEGARTLHDAVRGALDGHFANEWETRFADMVIDRRTDPFVKPFFNRSVLRGLDGKLR